jgi:hypothetical protein
VHDAKREKEKEDHLREREGKKRSETKGKKRRGRREQWRRRVFFVSPTHLPFFFLCSTMAKLNNKMRGLLLLATLAMASATPQMVRVHSWSGPGALIRREKRRDAVARGVL